MNYSREELALRLVFDHLFQEEFPGPGKAGERIIDKLFELEDKVSLAEEAVEKIVRAHDILREAIHNPECAQILPCLPLAIRPSYDALCWVLGHEKNREFGDALEITEKVLAAAGAEVVDRRCYYDPREI